MTTQDLSFSAGQDCGTRTAACVARLAALELVSDSRWWNRRKHRVMASALVACAEELESTADADRPRDESEAGQVPTPSPAAALPLRFA
jgi:hypothetical protein